MHAPLPAATTPPEPASPRAAPTLKPLQERLDRESVASSSGGAAGGAGGAPAGDAVADTGCIICTESLGANGGTLTLLCGE